MDGLEGGLLDLIRFYSECGLITLAFWLVLSVFIEHHQERRTAKMGK